MTKAQVIALIDQYITTNGNQEITGAQTNSVMKALANQDIPFADITNKPTTLSGYGITDAYTKSVSDGRYAIMNDVNANTGNLNIRQAHTGSPTLGTRGDSPLTIGDSFGMAYTQYGNGQGSIQMQRFDGQNATYDLNLNPLGGGVTINGNTAYHTGNLTLSTLGGEPVFSKNTAFNKNFGTTAGTVAQGNDSRINNGQTAYSWGNHANAGYVPSSRTITAGTGLTGGGNLSANRTLNVVFGTSAGTVMQGNSAYTKGESDGKYLLNTTDTFTGRLTFDNPISDGGIYTGSNSQRLLIGGGTQWSSSNGAYITLEGLNYGGTGSGGNITLAPSEGKVVNVTRSLSVINDVSVGGNITATGFYESSDIRLKENIEPLNYGLNEVLQLDTHTWDWKEDGKSDMGVIAQELENVMPELVKTNEEGYKSVNYTKLVPILINSIKELSNEIKALKNG